MSNVNSKLQYLVIKQLLNTGTVELILPDGVRLEVGIVQENEEGDFVKTDDYCYVVASREDKSVLLDTYNIGMQFEEKEDNFVCEGRDVTECGEVIRYMDVV